VSWFTDPNCEAAALLGHAVMAYAVDFDFPSGHVRLGTWSGNLLIGADTYLGVGKLGSISNKPDRASLTSERWSYSITGVDPSIIPESELDDCFGRSVTEYEVWINPETWAVIGTEINREGTMGPAARVDGKNPVITISVDDILVSFLQPDPWRYTTEHQEKFFSGDLGCDFARRNDSLELVWGGWRAVGGLVPSLADRVVNRT
jgi:hypothetical protein